MTILATSKTRRLPGPPTKIHCPKCGRESSAKSYQLEEKMGLFFIPFITQRETYVECNQCGSARLIGIPLMELDRYNADELEPHMYERISLVTKFMTLASVFLFCVPFVSLPFALVGFFASRRAGGWVKMTSIVGMALAGVGSLLWLAVIVMISQEVNRRPIETSHPSKILLTGRVRLVGV